MTIYAILAALLTANTMAKLLDSFYLDAAVYGFAAWMALTRAVTIYERKRGTYVTRNS